jgi:hypothetical protein
LSDFEKEYPPLEVGEVVIVEPFRWIRGVVDDDYEDKRIGQIVRKDKVNYIILLVKEERFVEVPRTKIRIATASELLSL